MLVPGSLRYYHRTMASASRGDESGDLLPAIAAQNVVDGGRTAAAWSAHQHNVANSRLSQLLKHTNRIIARWPVCDHGQLNRFRASAGMAATMAGAEIEEATICPNGTQNICVVCTPQEKNACAYVKAQRDRLGESAYRVLVYLPDDTCNGFMKGVGVEAQLRALIVNHSNTGATEAKSIKNTMAVVVLLEGIGKATAMALARRKARVILACRNMDKAKRAAQEILDSTGQSVVVKQLDLASFKSVNHFCDDILKTGVATRRARQQRWHRHSVPSYKV
ncbi:hypothetical protein HPB52_007604 [Rhipicephalus sanguineus]|uniref:Dehydrogenase n=1 Tax=Rhipicephalus sanguineus TaxID=34632 RepID=A0A9D4PHJ1_RHISA|nr:hypothetical protein HPB52_007604 [Rhipicephalus sanguineus]